MIEDYSRVLKKIYNISKENIYLDNGIVNRKKIKDYEEELMGLDEYLPNLLRRHIDLKYYSVLQSKTNIKKINTIMNSTREQSYELDVIEFINWVDSHQQFQELLLEDNLMRLADSLEILEKEYDSLK